MATPHVLIHGWPGSIIEFLDVIGPLTDPVTHRGDARDAFHLVVPSHPGFGFSGPTHEAGWTSMRIARAVAELMLRLGYDRYRVQGADFRAFIAPDMGRADPSSHVIGVHVNASTCGLMPWGEIADEEHDTFSEVEKEHLARLASFLAEGNGYCQIQATRPQTVAYGLMDSPSRPAGVDHRQIQRMDLRSNRDARWRDRSGSCSRGRYDLLVDPNCGVNGAIVLGIDAWT